MTTLFSYDWTWVHPTKGTFEIETAVVDQKPSESAVNNVRCFIWVDKKIVLVLSKYGDWQLPGGTVEEGESDTETLLREVHEEANIEHLDNITQLCWRVNHKTGQDKTSKVSVDSFFVATAKDLPVFVSDPAGTIVETKLVDLSEISKYLAWTPIESIDNLVEVVKQMR